MADILNARQDADLSPMDELENAMAEATGTPVAAQPAPAAASDDTEALFRLSAQLSAMAPDTTPEPTHPPHSDAAVPPVEGHEDEGLTDDALTEGIAAIFRNLADVVADADHPDAHEAAHDEDDEPTFALLGELDRLWHRPAH